MKPHRFKNGLERNWLAREVNMVNLARSAALCCTITTLICGLTSLLQLSCILLDETIANRQRNRQRCLEMLTFSSIRSCRVTKRKAKDDAGFGLGELSLRTRVWSNLAPIDEAQRPENEIALFKRLDLTVA